MTADANAPIMTAPDLFDVKPGLPEEDLATLNEYLSVFAVPAKTDKGAFKCANCDGEMDGFKEALGLGVAYRWGLAHGEANCSGCGWPARGMHYIKRPDGSELVTLQNFFLPYHFSFVTQRRQA